MTLADTVTRQGGPAAPASDAVRPAGPGRRIAAVAAELLLAWLPLLLAPLLAFAGFPVWLSWTVAGLAAVAVATALIAGLGRTGQTPPRRLLRLRTVGSDSLLPPVPAELAGRRTSTADLRTGRDPLLLPPSEGAGFVPVAEGGWQQPVSGGTGQWQLVLEDGSQLPIERSTLLGRSPANDDGADHALISLPDLSRSISRVHALVEPDADCLWLTDAGTTNGTRAASPSASGGTVIETRLRPGERVAVRAGGSIGLGDRTLRVTRAVGG